MGAYPQIADWNEDGKKDLLVGDTNGKISLFINTGTNSNPVLADSGYIKVDSVNIDVGLRAAPIVYDWNNDGKKDLIVGSESGNIKLFLNTGENNAPVFSGSSNLMLGNEPLWLWRCSPELSDFDKDGKVDLIVGEGYGKVHFFKNTGTIGNPKFEKDVLLYAEERHITVRSCSRVDITDWNEDGHDDLIIGGPNGYVHLFLNSGNVTDINDEPTVIPGDFILYQNYPNPFNPVTTIKFNIARPVEVKLEIYNAVGQLIRKTDYGYLPSGTYKYKWDGKTEMGKKVASGTYIYRMTAGSFTKVRRMLFIK